MANLKQNGELLKAEHVGVEIEMAGIGKQGAMHVVSAYYNEKYGIPVEEWHGGAHDAWNCIGTPAPNGSRRVWKFMNDASLSGFENCEMVTPILGWDDIPDLQEIVRRLRGAGAKSGARWGCGVHIHVDANFDEIGGHNAKTVRNLVNLIASHERLICSAINFTPSRQRYADFVETRFLNELNAKKPKTKRDLQKIWYNDDRTVHDHYHHSRYRVLNLHAIWDKNTIEFRCFEFHNNLHAGMLKAWIQLCMAMTSYAKLVRNCSPEIIHTNNPKYAMKNWLTNMGLIGDEFKTCRKLLLKNLLGDSGSSVARTHITDDDDIPTDGSTVY